MKFTVRVLQVVKTNLATYRTQMAAETVADCVFIIRSDF